MKINSKVSTSIALLIAIGLLVDYVVKIHFFYFLAIVVGLVIEVFYKRKAGIDINGGSLGENLKKAIAVLAMMLLGIVAFIVIALIS